MGWSATIGNVAHVANLVNIFAFAATVAQSAPFLDPVWKENGFCVSNPDVPYWTSHDLCLYADVILAAVAAVVYWVLHTERGMQPANELVKLNILGIIGHGMGHGSIAAGVRRTGVQRGGDEYGWDVLKEQSLSETLQLQIPFFLFWIMLLRSTMPKTTWSTISGLSVLSQIGSFFFPVNYIFTYVQTVLFMAFDVNELMKSETEKGLFEYALFPWMVGFPLGCVGWIESTMCSKGVIDIGGHLIYDAYVPFSLIFFYMICWLRTSSQQSAVPPKKKVA